MKQKRREPIAPPRIVIHSVDANCVRNICIPANVTTAKVADNNSEMLLETAEIKHKKYNIYQERVEQKMQTISQPLHLLDQTLQLFTSH